MKATFVHITSENCVDYQSKGMEPMTLGSPTLTHGFVVPEMCQIKFLEPYHAEVEL